MGKYIIRPQKIYLEGESYIMSPENKKVLLQKRRQELEEIAYAINETGIQDINIIKVSILFIVIEIPDCTVEQLASEVQNIIISQISTSGNVNPASIYRNHEQVSFPPKALWHLEAIGLIRARQNGYSITGKGVTVAVLDTGIDASHPELNGKISAAYLFDKKGCHVEALKQSIDTEGHGTYVAGLICGNVVGVAPDVNVISCIALPQGNGALSQFVMALDWIASRPEVQIVNISAGLISYVQALQGLVESLLYVGILPVASVGMEGLNSSLCPGNLQEVVSVGAINQNRHVASFSSSATLVVDHHQYTVPNVLAPGVDVYSCIKGGGYEKQSGTTAATAIVSGIAALILEEYPHITVMELREELLSSCLSLDEPVDIQGAGLVQIRA